MIPIDDQVIQQKYINGVLKRAEHHAPAVCGVAPSIIGHMTPFVDPGTMAARPYGGHLGNIVRAEFGGRRIVFRYEHDTAKIEAREGSLKGPVLAEFDNETPHARLNEFFSSL
jgi:hypothetical protein